MEGIMMVRFCSTCRKIHPIDTKKCPICGLSDLPRFCTKCRKFVPDGEKACPICGDVDPTISKTSQKPIQKKKVKKPIGIVSTILLFVVVAATAILMLHSGILDSLNNNPSSPPKCYANNHTWTYNVNAETKTCSVCGESEDFSPSGYYLNPIQIETDSFKPYFNDEHILCACDESTYERFNRSKDESLVKSLLEQGKLFYVDVDSTCDILSDTDMLAPQRHIVITSGKYNGTECWTAMAVVVNDSDVRYYKKWLNDPSNPINKDGAEVTGDNPPNSELQNPGSSSSANEFVGIWPGTYRIGTDIPAGTYRLVPLFSEYPGYWERCSNASGEMSAIISNDLFESTTYVTVKSGEYFEIKRCTGVLQ